MMRAICLCLSFVAASIAGAADRVIATGDLGVVVERATGSVLIVDQSEMATLARVEGFGDLSHASVVFSPDQRFAFVFGRDGGLTKVDIVARAIVNRVIQAGNSIGGAISDDGELVAVSNYEPGGVRVFDAAVGGLGGCPFAPGAAGNVATEAVNAHLSALGYQTGLDQTLIEEAAERNDGDSPHGPPGCAEISPINSAASALSN